MYHGVDACDFVLSLHAESYDLVDRKTDDERKHEAVDENGECSDGLGVELVPSETECCTNAGSEETNEQCSG